MREIPIITFNLGYTLSVRNVLHYMRIDFK